MFRVLFAPILRSTTAAYSHRFCMVWCVIALEQVLVWDSFDTFSTVWWCPFCPLFCMVVKHVELKIKKNKEYIKIASSWTFNWTYMHFLKISAIIISTFSRMRIAKYTVKIINIILCLFNYLLFCVLNLILDVWRPNFVKVARKPALV
jgi:hypothetical protein